MSLLDRLRQFTKNPQQQKPTVAPTSTPKKVAAPLTPVAKKKDAPAGKTVQLPNHILRRPHISEKGTLTQTYIFEVYPTATKKDVATAVLSLYGVRPKHVRMCNMPGKRVVWGKRAGSRHPWRKAIVRLQHGESINVYGSN